MSHVQPITLQITDIETARAACKAYGWTLTQATTFNTFQKGAKCDYKITVPDARYEVGLVKEGNHYVPMWDTFDSSLVRAMGGYGAPNLVRGYAESTMQKYARTRGYKMRPATRVETAEKKGVRLCLYR